MFRYKWNCTRLEFVRNEQLSYIGFLLQSIKYRIVYLFFRITYARYFGYPGSVVLCNDGSEWVVAYNDFQSTVVLYKDGNFRVIICYGKRFPRSMYDLASIDICTKTKEMHSFTSKPVHTTRILERRIEVCTFMKILESFDDIICHYSNYRDNMFELFSRHIIHLHHHLKFLCERHVLCIQRVFKKCVTNPAHDMCRRRLQREFRELITERD